MSRARYIEDADYDRTVDALAHAGRMSHDEVILILGEVGNIWPRGLLLNSIPEGRIVELFRSRISGP